MGNKTSNDAGSGCAKALETGVNDAKPTEQYKDLLIGSEYIHPTYCEYAGSGAANCGNTGEFISSGASDQGCKCHALCHDGCRRFKCKRVAFKGDPLECCSSQKAWLGEGKTCDPKYRNYNGSDCDEYMLKYCNENNNFFNNPNCKTWALKRGTVADKIILDVCRRKENAEKKECACVIAVDEFHSKFKSSTKVPAHCIDNRCTNNSDALKTTDMQTLCNLVNCEMNIEDLKIAQGATGGKYNVNFLQKCSANGKDVDGTKNTSPTDSVPDKTSDESSKESLIKDANGNAITPDVEKKKISGVVIIGFSVAGVVLLILILILILVMTK